MTEWPAEHISASETELVFGASALRWTDGRLEVTVDERSAPWGGRMRGRITVHPETVFDAPVQLDAEGRHFWYPLAPTARLEVDLEAPRARFSASGYHDANAGTEGLEAGFQRWSWARLQHPQGTAIVYDAIRDDGSGHCHAGLYGYDGSISELDLAPPTELPNTGWGVSRWLRAPCGFSAQIARTWENTPFYARSLLRVQDDASGRFGVHETVDLQRFPKRWVQTLLPFRIRRGRR